MEEPLRKHDIALLDGLGCQDSLCQLVSNLQWLSKFQLVELLDMEEACRAGLSLEVGAEEYTASMEVVEEVLEDVNWVKQEENPLFWPDRVWNVVPQYLVTEFFHI